MNQVFVLFVVSLALGLELKPTATTTLVWIRRRGRATYIVCKTWYDGNPDLICTDGQMRICSDEEVVEQAHVGHGL
jgi:hypothetical protein